jgi:hypothetical protein
MPGTDGRSVMCKQGDCFVRMQGTKTAKADGTEKVFLSPRTHINIPKKATTYTTSKNILYANLVSNIMTKAKSLLSKRNTSEKKLCIKVQLIFYLFLLTT